MSAQLRATLQNPVRIPDIDIWSLYCILEREGRFETVLLYSQKHANELIQREHLGHDTASRVASIFERHEAPSSADLGYTHLTGWEGDYIGRAIAYMTQSFASRETGLTGDLRQQLTPEGSRNLRLSLPPWSPSAICTCLSELPQSGPVPICWLFRSRRHIRDSRKTYPVLDDSFPNIFSLIGDKLPERTYKRLDVITGTAAGSIIAAIAHADRAGSTN
jgi:hypothetical protein